MRNIFWRCILKIPAMAVDISKTNGIRYFVPNSNGSNSLFEIKTDLAESDQHFEKSQGAIMKLKKVLSRSCKTVSNR